MEEKVQLLALKGEYEGDSDLYWDLADKESAKQCFAYYAANVDIGQVVPTEVVEMPKSQWEEIQRRSLEMA